MRIWIGIFAGLIAVAQAPDRFEITSAKINEVPPRNRQFSFECSTSGRLRSFGNELRRSVLRAYDLKYYELVWNAKLDGNSAFDIEADAGREITQEQCRRMFQNLLADRFKLRTHREERNIDLYALTTQADGAKLELASESDKLDFVINGTPLQFSDGKERPNGWSMQLLTSLLNTGTVDRPVVDHTGLTGVYKTPMNFEAGPAGMPLPGNRPDVFEALRKIGLKLKSRKEPMQVLIVDSVELPDAN